MQYEDLAEKALRSGDFRSDRTGVGVYSIFGAQISYDLREGFPLITTKRVNYAAVVKELLWFLRGETNTKTLGSKIWDEWATDNGDLGPIYGKQWRSWGFFEADQIRNLCDGLRQDPYSRRHVVSAWNVDALNMMRLHPCHIMFQCFVGNHKGLESPHFLDLHLYQRSADIALGVPFNIASYATLLMLLAQHADLVPRNLVISYGDAHVYKNHVEGLSEQLTRPFRPLPSLALVDVSREAPRTIDSVRGLTVDNFQLVKYNPHPAIKFEVAK